MRAMIIMAAAGVMAAGCTQRDAATDTSTPVTNTAAAAGMGNTAATGDFSPPSSISRLDYGSRAERRFRKLDTNQDSKLNAAELPDKRGAKMLKRGDTNSDGAIDSTEWSTAMLARFDKKDKNNDGTLTTDERGGKQGKRGGKRGDSAGTADDAAIDESEEDLDNAF